MALVLGGQNQLQNLPLSVAFASSNNSLPKNWLVFMFWNEWWFTFAFDWSRQKLYRSFVVGIFIVTIVLVWNERSSKIMYSKAKMLLRCVREEKLAFNMWKRTRRLFRVTESGNCVIFNFLTLEFSRGGMTSSFLHCFGASFKICRFLVFEYWICWWNSFSYFREMQTQVCTSIFFPFRNSEQL